MGTSQLAGKLQNLSAGVKQIMLIIVVELSSTSYLVIKGRRFRFVYSNYK